MGDPIYNSLRNAEMKWLEATVVRRSHVPFDRVPPSEQSRIAQIVERLAWTIELAVAHEFRKAQVGVRDDAMFAYAERVAIAITSNHFKRTVIRVIWRLHVPLTWILRRVKVAASNGEKLPAHNPDQCTLARPIPRRIERNFGICTWRCDADFYLKVVDLTLAELGMLLLLKKSTVDAWSEQCPIAHGRREGKRIAPPSAAWTQEQVAAYWDALRGQGALDSLRTTRHVHPRFVFSWLHEIGDVIRMWWLRLS